MNKMGFADWAILEVLGHRRLAGYVTEVELAGAGFLRIDIPGLQAGAMTSQFYGPSAVYALTPTSEETARAFAVRNQPAPIHRWDLPTLPEAGETHSDYEEEGPDPFADR
jgi:hypothetical protein